MAADAPEEAGWRVSPRLLRILAVCIGFMGLVLPAVVVKWVTATTKSVEQPDVGPLRPEMVIVPASTYTIGSPESEEGRSPDEEQHRVTLTRPFAIAVTEVTQAQYARVMGENPSTEESCGKCPVTDVSWLAAVRYSIQLSEQDPGAEPCYLVNGEQVTWLDPCTGYRLPTEAEWEVAARATTSALYAGTDDPDEICLYGNVADSQYKEAEKPSWATFECDDGFAGLAPVRSFSPNGFRLYDMTGNVWEWVWDWYETYEIDARDPRGPASGQYRVFRGGSFVGYPRNARVALRYDVEPSRRLPDLGFRVARSLP